MATVLVADDDGHIREVVRYALQKAGFRVVEAADGAQALRLLREETVDLAVLDIVMPEHDGLDVCRRVRTDGDLPVLFLTSLDEELDRIVGLELGADDYISKPFSPRELVARVRAVLRRTRGRAPDTPGAEGIVRHGGLSLDADRHQCLWAGGEVELTVTEFALLGALMGRPGKVYTRSELMDRAYGLGQVVTERTVDSHIRHIRRKLAEAGATNPIETVHGLGYRLRETPP